MPVLAALSLEITRELVASVVGGFLVCIGAITVGAWKAVSVWQGLKTTKIEADLKLEQEQRDRAATLAKQDAEIRENMLIRYQQMYELEKERGTNDMQVVERKIESIRLECAEWDDKYRKLRGDYDTLKEKYEKVVQLNIQYQQDKAKDTAEIDRLTKSLNELRRHVETLDKHHIAEDHHGGR